MFCSTCSEGLVSRPQPSLVSLSTAHATAATWPDAAMSNCQALTVDQGMASLPKHNTDTSVTAKAT